MGRSRLTELINGTSSDEKISTKLNKDEMNKKIWFDIEETQLRHTLVAKHEKYVFFEVNVVNDNNFKLDYFAGVNAYICMTDVIVLFVENLLLFSVKL